jgi:hypothetical protein
MLVSSWRCTSSEELVFVLVRCLDRSKLTRCAFALLNMLTVLCRLQDRDPLNLCKAVAPHLAALEGQVVSLSPGAPVAKIDHGQHLQTLKCVAVLKMMRQLAGAYSVMRVDAVAALVPFMPFSEVETVLADAVKFGFVQVRVCFVLAVFMDAVKFGFVQAHTLVDPAVRLHIAT